MKHSHAFSLVELSIVLVIIGLLVGGILTGQDLIQAAKTRSVISEAENYKTAVSSFRDKYIAIPGDMTNASAFWGEMTNCDAASPARTDTQTCDGDGNRAIGAGTAAQTGEAYGFWQHLANAGMIEGDYNGVAGANDPYHAVIGTNVPSSARVENAGWFAATYSSYAGDTEAFAYQYGNFLAFGTESTDNITQGAALTPIQAYNVDDKVDDGQPGTGGIIASMWDDCTDAASNGSATAADRDNALYILTDENIQCGLFFTRAF